MSTGMSWLPAAVAMKSQLSGPFQISSTRFWNTFSRGEVDTAVKAMVHAGSFGLKSTRISTNRREAFLLLVCSTTGGLLWRELVCPFGYKFGDGDRADVSEPESIAWWIGSNHLQNDAKVFWSLYRIMRSDPRRNFTLKLQYMAPCSVPDCCAEQGSSPSYLSTGPRSVRFPCFGH